MSKCGVCHEIVFDKEEALLCDGECTKWYTTAYVLECRVDNITYIIKAMTDITHCNGYAIAVRSKIKKSSKVKCLSHGTRWKT